MESIEKHILERANIEWWLSIRGNLSSIGCISLEILRNAGGSPTFFPHAASPQPK